MRVIVSFPLSLNLDVLISKACEGDLGLLSYFSSLPQLNGGIVQCLGIAFDIICAILVTWNEDLR